MSDVTAAAAAASAAASGASVAGLPPQGVIACAVVGAVIGVWVSRPSDAEVSWRWAVGSVGLVAAYASVAVFAASAWDAVAPAYAASPGALAPLARIPSWVVSGGMALGGFWFLPLLAAWCKRRAGL